MINLGMQEVNCHQSERTAGDYCRVNEAENLLLDIRCGNNQPQDNQRREVRDGVSVIKEKLGSPKVIS
jgi:hypothetical protein